MAASHSTNPLRFCGFGGGEVKGGTRWAAAKIPDGEFRGGRSDFR